MNIGVAWIKKSSSGKEYIKIKIGEGWWLTMFPNDRKQNEKQPDYNVVWNPPEFKKDVDKSSSGDKVSSDDNSNIPF